MRSITFPRTNEHKKQRRPLLLLFGAVLSFMGLGYIIYYVSPANSYAVYSVNISVILVFLFLITVFFFSAGTYVLNSKIHGLLLALLVTVYLIFRLNGLTHPFFAILLLSLFLVLELMFTFKK